MFNTLAGAAAFFDTAEIAIAREEAKAVSDATKEFLKFHPVEIDPAKVAGVNLAIVCGSIIAVHWGAYKIRMSFARQKNQPLSVPDPKSTKPAPAAAAQAAPPPSIVAITDLFKGARSPADLNPEGGALPPGYSPN